MHPDGKLEAAEVALPQDNSPGSARPRREQFASATSEVTGESKSQINRHIVRAEAFRKALIGSRRQKSTDARLLGL